MHEPKVALEVAEAEFERFFEAMDLSVDVSTLDDDDRKSFEKNKKIFVEAVQRGKLAVNESGEPVFTPSKGGTIIFHEPTGAALMAMDQCKKDAGVTRTFAVMAAMSGQPAKCFALMPQRDLKVCEAIFVLFLAAK